MRTQLNPAASSWRACSLVALALLFTIAADARNLSLPEARPESVGFSSERLKRLDAGMKAIVDSKQLAGIATVVARRGQVVQQLTYGQADVDGGKAMQMDSIVRIYSMTKPITGVAMMMLYEQGKWKPSDPISRHIPEFKDLKVFAGHGADGQPTLVAPTHAPTMGELMSHTAGFTYGVFGSTPVDKLYQQVEPLTATSLQDFIERMAKLPLLYQPGEGWVYSVGVDIQGYLVEKLSGQPFPDFLRERIFEPLGMKDTAFYVPEDKMSRLATIYSWSAAGLRPMPHDVNVNELPRLPSGGGGLYSTAADYLRFAQMLANKGQLDGKRLLAPSTVALMTANHVPDVVKNQNGKFGIGMYRMQPGFGFGYDVAVYEEPLRVGSPAGKGTYLWDGLAGTWFWIDPTNEVVFLGIIQRRGGPPGAPNIEDLSRQLTFQALVEPAK
ncbi:beta-lactamase family protein [Steroidobacter sp. S1-65]|uniref:Beta-lactamase family protein n=1 Tax=Steroidobacter gossypii TaxID=2805490 RepID=A0ABS1X4Y2_9GAMM|nr:serine hydrolase domain-containing protein [Steroidobacter gossypii]MBM0108270.1 beta-lactamase family protein [Steroidobacter gossypii]